MGKTKKKDLPDLGYLALRGTAIPVRVTPKAARNAIVPGEGALKVTVTTAPENGKATQAVRALLAKAMGIAASHIELRSGTTSRSKIFVYTGPDAYFGPDAFPMPDHD